MQDLDGLAAGRLSEGDADQTASLDSAEVERRIAGIESDSTGLIIAAGAVATRQSS